MVLCNGFLNKEKTLSSREQDLEEQKDPEKPDQIGIVVEQVVELRIKNILLII